MDLGDVKAEGVGEDCFRRLWRIELDGEEAKLEADLERTGNVLFDLDALEVLVAQHSGERERLWASRRELSHSLKRQAANKLSEDVVVPRTKIADLLGYCAELADRHELVIPTYGHAGDGNLHVNFLWNDPDERARVDANTLHVQVLLAGGLDQATVATCLAIAETLRTACAEAATWQRPNQSPIRVGVSAVAGSLPRLPMYSPRNSIWIQESEKTFGGGAAACSPGAS